MEKEVKLPTKLAKLGLSHQEIGALFVALCLDDMNQEERLLWEEDLDLNKTLEKLVAREIIKIHPMDDEMTIDLSFLDEEIYRPFWEIWDYDGFNNPIYYHDSIHSYDEGNTYSYRIMPVVRDGKLVYVYCGDREIIYDTSLYDDSFETLEEAQHYFEELIGADKKGVSLDEYRDWRDEL